MQIGKPSLSTMRYFPPLWTVDKLECKYYIRTTHETRTQNANIRMSLCGWYATSSRARWSVLVLFTCHVCVEVVCISIISVVWMMTMASSGDYNSNFCVSRSFFPSFFAFCIRMRDVRVRSYEKEKRIGTTLTHVFRSDRKKNMMKKSAGVKSVALWRKIFKSLLLMQCRVMHYKQRLAQRKSTESAMSIFASSTGVSCSTWTDK